MALKRADIRKIFQGVEGVTDEHIGSILDLVHEETDDLRDQIDDLKKSGKNDKWEKKYNDEHEAFEKYKSDHEAEKTKATKSSLFAELLKDSGLSEAGQKKALKYTDLDEIEIGKDGKIKDAAGILKSVKEEWSDYVTEKGEKGTETKGKDGAGAAGNGGGTGTGTKKTKEEILDMTDPIARQRAMSENHELFGF